METWNLEYYVVGYSVSLCVIWSGMCFSTTLTLYNSNGYTGHYYVHGCLHLSMTQEHQFPENRLDVETCKQYV